MNCTWIITGSAGFIGSNLTNYLLQHGHSIIGLDNLSTGKQENVIRSKEIGGPRYQFSVGNICDKKIVDDLMSCSVDFVVHLAAQSSVQRSFDNVEKNNHENIDGFINVLLSAGKYKVKKFIYASSASVYGDTDLLPIKEDRCPNPLSPYASTKLMNDMFSKNFYNIFPGMQFIGLRFFNIFGPWQDPYSGYAAVIPKWIDRLLSNSKPVIFGDGSATRDFCYIKDVCDLIINISKSSDSNLNGVYNVSSGSSINLKNLYLSIYKIISSSGFELSFDDPDFLPWKKGDILHSLGSIDLAKRKLEFNPDTSLEHGIKNILKIQYNIKNTL